MQKIFCIILLLISLATVAQQKLAPLTIEKIMSDPKWIGSSPSNPYWSADSKFLLFNWNPDKAPSDSLYYISKENKAPAKATYAFRQQILTNDNLVYNLAETWYVYAKEGDIYLHDNKKNTTKKLPKPQI